MEEFYEIYKGVVPEYLVSLSLTRICLKIKYAQVRKLPHFLLLGIVMWFLLLNNSSLLSNKLIHCENCVMCGII